MNALQRVSQWKPNHPILAGIVNSFIWMAMGALALSVLLYSSSANEDKTLSYIYLVHIIALFIGGWTAGRRSGRRGWYYGGLTGFCYAMLVLIIGFLAMDAGISLQKLVLVVAACACSALGGIFGVNMSRNK
ncbi:TIGR04086 family membrane protein [Paenibacillus thiaminolyticus]|uniref:TIGR04086 family membrane protein n=1 Tax=Paenibacillus thiaminolyticus TaxID=49283 RepID=A0AAP9J369_PANTH|nr:TIGR04086 family membrane protein [Paenibacillus thiaminolyticus]MCY9534152.1 TIGR04086 family membrane protein [Paenibacillus thiaminolyticus]MCY9604671.1 TIGR04086 family membrane protein [Paenibacillus thiaminolyticus]MCY9610170.1 TIGR04086 family membrane protein [Paenibacillus thiaminolyticus]MCY9614679.1 TIGR04086 family membrane protein [Paenibacillus thiaminolyticus]MCY9621864.1 TIGR04086 family membrane protein [Paenibacillus thiaminolyticus]